MLNSTRTHLPPSHHTSLFFFLLPLPPPPHTQNAIIFAQVSWVRRKSGDANLDLLTVGKHTYSGDPRYKIEFQYPDNWRLRLEAAVKDDEGTYECQISTHPPRIIQKNVFVNGE